MDAHKSPLSLIILDSLESILEHGPNYFSHSMYQTLNIYLRQKPPKHRKLLVVATSSDLNAIQQVGLVKPFSANIHVPQLNAEDIKSVLVKKQVFASLEHQDLPKVLQLLPEHIGIKRLLHIIDMARVRRLETTASNEQEGLSFSDIASAINDNADF